MDEEELPNALLDSYLSEASCAPSRWRTAGRSTRTAGTSPPSTRTSPSPPRDPAGIAALIDHDSGFRLMQIGIEPPKTTSSRLGDATRLLHRSRRRPHPVARHRSTTCPRLHAARSPLPADWVTGGAGAAPDCDIRLHQLLAHYAIALCYAQQEDEVLEDVYMKRWQASFVAARNAICSTPPPPPAVSTAAFRCPTLAPVAWASPPVHP